MRSTGKYILMVMLFAGFLFFYSDGIQKTENTSVNDVVTVPGKTHCSYNDKDNVQNKQDVENPGYVPVNCDNCPGAKNDYWHEEIVGDRECYFGKNIKKQN